MPIIIKKLEQNVGKVKILVVYSFITFFLLITGSALFPQWTTNWNFNVIIYTIGVVLFAISIEKLPRELTTPLFQNIIAFSIAVIFTSCMLYVVKEFGLMFHDVPPMPAYNIPANMMFNLFPVAVSEEIIFRGFIFGWLYDRFKLRPERATGEVKRWGWVIPYLLQALIFTGFHYGVYGFNFSIMPLLFIMSIVFAYVTERVGIGASIGGHWIWNCFALGIIQAVEITI